MKRNQFITIIGLLVLLVGLLPPMALRAQDVRTNMEKYWLYRARLWDRFIVLGTGQGMGIPAALYNDDYYDPSQWGGLAHKKGLGWSDATAHLGYYIAMLATEYAVLDAVGDPTTKNVEELYYALNALWRLDASSGLYSYDSLMYDAGGCYDPSGPIPGPMNVNNYNDPNQLDGFFIRDDVPGDFAKHFTHYDTIASNLTAPISHKCRGKEMSQDQVTALMLGLICVKNFVDPNVTWNGVPLVGFAVTEGLRILDHCKANGGWVIRNPHIQGDPPVERGPSGFGFPPALSFIGFRLSDDSVRLTNALDFLENPAWQSFQYPYWLSGNTKYINETMISNLAAVGNSWGPCPNVYTDPVSQYLLCALTGTFATTTDTRQGLDRYVLRAKEAQYLIHHLIYSSNWAAADNISEQSILAMLDSAPCEGPSSPYPNAGIYGWTTENRFWVPRKSDDGSNDNLLKGKKNSDGEVYSGIDYMLLHNLYYLWRFKNGYGIPLEFPYENLLEADITRDWPIMMVGVSRGSQASPITIRAIDRITCTSDVRVLSGGGSLANRTGDVTLRAGDQIDLKPGFTAALGTELRAFIWPMECVSGVINRSAQASPQDDYLYQLYQQAAWEEQRYMDSLSNANPMALADTLGQSQVNEIGRMAVRVFPNPSSGKLTIQISSPTSMDNATLRLVNPAGTIDLLVNTGLELRGGDNEITLDLQGKVPAGLYSLVLTTSAGTIFRQIAIID
jgi:hypothetical protein